MAKKNQQPIEPDEKPEDTEFEDLNEKEPEIEEFMEIGGPPAPGIALIHILRGHTAPLLEELQASVTPQ